MLTTKRTDNYDSVTWQCENEDGSRVDLTGATAQFIMGKKNKLITNAPAQITSAIDGIVQYKLTDSDTLVSGTFLAEFEVTFPNGTKKTFPSNGYITVAIGDNLDNGQVNVVLDMIAAKQGDFEAKLSAILAQAGNINMSSIDEYTWSAIANQTVYTFPITSSYTRSAKWFKVYVGGIPVDDSLISRQSFDTKFELLIDPSVIKEGTTVKAEWMQPMAAIAPTSYKVIPQQSSPPVDAVEGDMWFDTSDDTYQGTILEGIDTRMTNAETSLADIALQVGNPTGGDDTDLIQNALNLGKTQKRTVLLKPNQTYIVYRKGTKPIRDTINNFTYGYSLIVPNGVTFDLNGSTIKLANGQDSAVLINENPDATSDATLCTDQNIHVRNGIIDGNNTNQTSTYWQAGIYFAKVKNGSLKNLKVINARMDGFRIMGLRNCELDQLYAINIQGHGFYIGRNDPGAYDLRLFDCTIGVISGENCITGFYFPSPSNGTQTDGNSIHFMAVNTTVETMIDKNTSLGIKIAGGGSLTTLGSQELQVGKIICNGSPVKFQHIPQRVQVGLIDVSNSPTWAVAMIDPNNLQIGKINCYNCQTNDETNGQVVLCNGTNVNIDDITLDSCFSAQSILFQAGSDKYNVKHVRITNCKGAVEIPSTGTTTITDMSIIKDPALPATYRGVNISGSNSKVHIGKLSISGNFLFGDYFVSQASTNVKIGTLVKEGVNESGRVITLTAAGGSTVVLGSALNLLYKVYGSYVLLPIIRFIPVSSASAAITITRYKINASTGDLTIYHQPNPVGTEQFIMQVEGYTGSSAQLT